MTGIDAALRAAGDAHLAIIDHGEVPDEVLARVQIMWDELYKMIDIYRGEYEYEKWWDYFYYHSRGATPLAMCGRREVSFRI